MDYRKKFKEFYGIDFGPEYHVHHIDQNRGNNDISNLMILPADLHGEYHQRLRELVMCTSPDITNPDYANKDFKEMFKICGTNESEFLLSAFYNFFDVLSECQKWYDYKLYLNGKIPNVHNIKL